MTSKSHGERLGGRETGRKGGKEGRKEGGREGAPRVTSSATLVHTLMRAYNVHAENGSGAAATFRTHCLFMNQQHKKNFKDTWLNTDFGYTVAVRNAVFKRRSLNLMTECLPMTSSFQEARAGARTRFTFLLLNKLKNLRASRETTAELRRFDATHRLSELGPPTLLPYATPRPSTRPSLHSPPACRPAVRSQSSWCS